MRRTEIGLNLNSESETINQLKLIQFQLSSFKGEEDQHGTGTVTPQPNSIQIKHKLWFHQFIIAVFFYFLWREREREREGGWRERKWWVLWGNVTVH